MISFAIRLFPIHYRLLILFATLHLSLSTLAYICDESEISAVVVALNKVISARGQTTNSRDVYVPTEAAAWRVKLIGE